jgi:hypothetical protein
MAKQKQDPALALEAIIGSSVRVDDGKGGNFLVPSGQVENRIANQILASQMRHLIQEHIKTFRDKEAVLTPKEIRDMAEAARSVATFSGEVYSQGESIPPRNEIKDVMIVGKEEKVDFDMLTSKTEPIKPEPVK